MIPITIDGQNIEVPPGITVLKAAELAGIHIPTLCNHPALKPYGACRLCVVEVEGARTLQASCTMPVFKGMVVRTNTPKVNSAREFVLTLIFSERNHFCMYCQKSDGDCELQNSAYAEGMTHWPIQPNWDSKLVDASSPYFVFDHNRCILCRRCVRTCGELVGNFTLSLENRGANSNIVADAGALMGESSCIRCGNCVQFCPTGTLIDRKGAYQSKEVSAVHVESTCVGCSVGCGIDVLVANNRVFRINGLLDAPVNNGILCETGRYQEAFEQPNRIVSPMVKKNGKLEKASWEEAIQTTAAHLTKASKNGGVSALASTRLSTEALFTFSELFKDGKSVSSIEEGFTSVGDAITLYGSLEDLKNADCVVVFGADLVKNHMVSGFFVKRNLSKGTVLIVVDPSQNEMETVAQYSLKPVPGSDKDVIEGLISAVSALGMSKEPVPARFTPASLASASEACGIPRDLLVAVGREIGCAQNPVIVIGKGLVKEKSTAALQALAELARIVNAKAIINTKGKANSSTAQKLNLDQPLVTEGASAAFIDLGDDLAPDRLAKRINGLPFTAVMASYSSELTSMADVVFPVETCFEQEGHYINMEGRVQQAHRSITPPSGVESNTNVLMMLAKEMGVNISSDWETKLAPAQVS